MNGGLAMHQPVFEYDFSYTLALVLGEKVSIQAAGERAEEAFAVIDDSSGSDESLVWYRATLRAAIMEFRDWLTSLHLSIVPPPGTFRYGELQCRVLHYRDTSSSDPSRLHPSISSVANGSISLGWILAGGQTGDERNWDTFPSLPMVFTTQAIGWGRFQVTAVCVTVPFFLEHFKELLFHSTFGFATHETQIRRVGLWRSGLGTILGLWQEQTGDERRGSRRRPLKPYQRPIVEERLTLVDEGEAPLQQFFAQKHYVTDRTVRNRMAKHREGAQGFRNFPLISADLC